MLAPPSEPAAGRYDYTRFSQLSGQVTDPPDDASSRIRYRRLPNTRPLRSIFGALTVIATQMALFVWILLPRHWPLVGEDLVLWRLLENDDRKERALGEPIGGLDDPDGRRDLAAVERIQRVRDTRGGPRSLGRSRGSGPLALERGSSDRDHE